MKSNKWIYYVIYAFAFLLAVGGLTSFSVNDPEGFDAFTATNRISFFFDKPAELISTYLGSDSRLLPALSGSILLIITVCAFLYLFGKGMKIFIYWLAGLLGYNTTLDQFWKKMKQKNKNNDFSIHVKAGRITKRPIKSRNK